MKNLLFIATGAIAIGLGIMIYRKKYSKQQIQHQPEPVFIPKKHHLTNAFAKAKKHSLN